MRSWENRSDSMVVDEPLYAAYLLQTGLDHPGRAEIIAAGETDPRHVVASLLGAVPAGVDVFYQKHMAHHLLPEFGADWVLSLTNVLLIREPGEVVASYVRSRAEVTPEDIGLPQQARLYDLLSATSGSPVVIDSADFLRNPETYLRAMCDLADVSFEDGMLSWPAGPRESDGVWAPYWYDAVLASTGFEPYRPREIHLEAEAAEVARACGPMYERLHEARLRL